MDFKKSEGPSLLPAIPGVLGLGEAAARIMARADTQQLNIELRKTLYWSLRLMQMREEIRSVARGIHGVQRVMFGFMDPEDEIDAFGVIIMASGEREDRDSGVLLIFAGDAAFPVRVRRVTEVPHQVSMPQPTTGSAGIWARSRVLSPRPVGPGVLTVKHVAGSTIGAHVPMTCGCAGRVADVAPSCIDGALVTCSCPVPSLRVVAPWMAVPGSTPVEFHGTASSAAIATHVTATTDILGIYSTPELPITLALAVHGAAGDSGALVSETTVGSTRAPVGLYWGQYVTPSGATGGLARHIGQVGTLMDMELLR